MKTELDKHKDALAVVYHTIDSILEHVKYGQGVPTNQELLQQALRLVVNDVTEAANEIAYHLADPPPEYEEIEETVGWVNVYKDNENGTLRRGIAEDHEHAALCEISPSPRETYVATVPIKVTVKREKRKPIEKAVTVRAHITDGNHGGFYEPGHVVTPDCKRNVFANHPELRNKDVLLTAVWVE
jgi:hypothetical protein